MRAGAPSAEQSQAQHDARPCTLLGVGLSSNWRQATVLQLCPSSPPTVVLWRDCGSDLSVHSGDSSVFQILSAHSKHQRPNSHLLHDHAAETVLLWTNRTTLPPDMTPAHRPFLPRVVPTDQTGEMGRAGLNPLLCLARAQGQHLRNTTSSPFPFPLLTAVCPALELHPVPQAWKLKGLICCSSCRLQYVRILGHPWRQNDICMLNAIEREHNALKPLRKSTGQLIWFKPIFKFYETHFQG